MRKYRKAKNLKNPWDTGPFKSVNSATFTAIDFKLQFSLPQEFYFFLLLIILYCH